MTHSPDPHQLRDTQYKTGANLLSRINLHERFKTNPYNWFQWVFDHFDLPSAAHILELGCGPGRLWQANLERIPPGWQITLSDFSPGMVAEAQANLGQSASGWRFEVINAQQIPLPDGCLDAVIANHMLYHVADLPQAVREIRRVLKPAGTLYAATNGLNHMLQIWELGSRAYPGIYELRERMFTRHAFSLENGAQILGAQFSNVRMERYPDALEVTEAEPLLAYIHSMLPAELVELASPQAETVVRAAIEKEIQTRGALRVDKDTGLFIAA